MGARIGPTAVFSERQLYLRLQFGKQVDGLVFPSVQTGEVGTNVVLFPEASVISKEHYYPPDEMERLIGKGTVVEQPDY